jgi:uncharacterized membrane protein
LPEKRIGAGREEPKKKAIGFAGIVVILGPEPILLRSSQKAALLTFVLLLGPYKRKAKAAG